MPTKILYVVGTDSSHDNIELKWSLRSLDKFATDEVEPVICGFVPDWFKGEAVEMPDPTYRKEKNINAKILRAIETELVTGDFQLSADDHFWLQPTEFASLPIYYRNEFIEANPDGNNYARALCGTKDVLLKSGYTDFNTACHCNTWANADDADTVRKLIERADGNPYAAEYGLVAWAVWPNVYKKHAILRQFVYKYDLKIRDQSYFMFKTMITGERIVSVNDSAFENPDIVNFFTELYSGKSRWEK